MSLPADQTTVFSEAIEAVVEQTCAVTGRLGQAMERSASYLSLPFVDDDARADFDSSTYLSTLASAAAAMVEGSAAMMATLSDNAVMLSSRISIHWVSEWFELPAANGVWDLRPVTWVNPALTATTSLDPLTRLPVKPLPARLEREDPNANWWRLHLVSRTSYVTELRFTCFDNVSGTTAAPVSDEVRRVSMSVNFDKAV
ncbi:MAG: hypothetical protein AAF567_26300 [Actinomycetota bacterium]